MLDRTHHDTDSALKVCAVRCHVAPAPHGAQRVLMSGIVWPRNYTIDSVAGLEAGTIPAYSCSFQDTADMLLCRHIPT